eukprot:CAMPEP_0179359860 /NCGR_PEP_ID=MMETSP0797-20121207/79667_1 /TAXON_ID=47934 /ORGANISM="Dinophysis acuminata, Strain DAEP01" /LENGTH=44 /DNA_ID= /DNA_START= /DNA_END= /DNA_ORIENTATION=
MATVGSGSKNLQPPDSLCRGSTNPGSSSSSRKGGSEQQLQRKHH